MKRPVVKKPRELDPFDLPRPQDLEAERAVLGSILLKPRIAAEVQEIVSANDFFDEGHQRLFGHITTLIHEGKHPDLVILVDRLKESCDLEFVGGNHALAELSQAVPTAGNARFYAQIVRKKAQLRAIRDLGLDGACDASRELAAPGELLGRLADRLDALHHSPVGATLLTADKAVDQALAVARESLAGQARRGLPTGLACFDFALGGLFAGELSIFAGRPGNGKTALGLQVAAHNAGRNSPVLFVSCEMSAPELLNRLLCGEGDIDVGLVRTCSLSAEEFERLEVEGDHWRTRPLSILDGPASAADVRRIARRMKQNEGLSLIVVDYLQKLEPTDRKAKRYEQVGQLSTDLKRIARELNVPLLCLAQLSREVESAAHCQPRLSHLRESGDIEQDADLVGLIHQPWLYTRDPDHWGKAELLIAKNRNGPTTHFSLLWDGQRTRFHEPDQNASPRSQVDW